MSADFISDINSIMFVFHLIFNTLLSCAWSRTCKLILLSSPSLINSQKKYNKVLDFPKSNWTASTIMKKTVIGFPYFGSSNSRGTIQDTISLTVWPITTIICQNRSEMNVSQLHPWYLSFYIYFKVPNNAISINSVKWKV